MASEPLLRKRWLALTPSSSGVVSKTTNMKEEHDTTASKLSEFAPKTTRRPRLNSIAEAMFLARVKKAQHTEGGVVAHRRIPRTAQPCLPFAHGPVVAAVAKSKRCSWVFRRAVADSRHSRTAGGQVPALHASASRNVEARDATEAVAAAVAAFADQRKRSVTNAALSADPSGMPREFPNESCEPAKVVANGTRTTEITRTESEALRRLRRTSWFHRKLTALRSGKRVRRSSWLYRKLQGSIAPPASSCGSVTAQT